MPLATHQTPSKSYRSGTAGSPDVARRQLHTVAPRPCAIQMCLGQSLDSLGQEKSYHYSKRTAPHPVLSCLWSTVVDSVDAARPFDRPPPTTTNSAAAAICRIHRVHTPAQEQLLGTETV